MTWTLFHTMPDSIRPGMFIVFGSNLVYITDGVGVSGRFAYTLVVGSLTETEILDMWVDTNVNIEPQLFMFGSTLFMAALDQNVTVYTRYIYSYDGTPNNWTEEASLTQGGDTALASTCLISTTPAGTTLVVNLGIQTPPTDANEHVGRSTDGSSWDLTSITNVNIAVIGNQPITVQSDDVYVPVLWNPTGDYRYAAYDNNNWTVSTAEYDVPTTYTLVRHFWGGSSVNGNPFTGIWLRRVSDGALLRSTDGGETFSTTVTDTAATMTILASSTGIGVYASGGYEYCPSNLGGTTRLWYFDGSVWRQVDDGAIPGNPYGIVLLDGTLYLATGDEIYITDEFPPPTPSGGGILGLSLSEDKETDGTKVFLTAYDADAGELLLQRWETDPVLSLEMEISLGTATLSDVENRLAVAYVWAASGTQIWLYGRIVGGSAGPTGTFWLAESNSGGESGSFSAFAMGWSSTDVMGALWVSDDLTGGDDRMFYGVRNRVGAQPQLYTGLNALTLAATIGMTAGTFVRPGAFAVGRSGNVVVGADDTDIGAGGRVTLFIAPTFSAGSALDGSLPSGSVSTLRFL